MRNHIVNLLPHPQNLLCLDLDITGLAVQNLINTDSVTMQKFGRVASIWSEMYLRKTHILQLWCLQEEAGIGQCHTLSLVPGTAQKATEESVTGELQKPFGLARQAAHE